MEGAVLVFDDLFAHFEVLLELFLIQFLALYGIFLKFLHLSGNSLLNELHQEVELIVFAQVI